MGIIPQEMALKLMFGENIVEENKEALKKETAVDALKRKFATWRQTGGLSLWEIDAAVHDKEMEMSSPERVEIYMKAGDAVVDPTAELHVAALEIINAFVESLAKPVREAPEKVFTNSLKEFSAMLTRLLTVPVELVGFTRVPEELDRVWRFAIKVTPEVLEQYERRDQRELLSFVGEALAARRNK